MAMEVPAPKMAMVAKRKCKSTFELRWPQKWAPKPIPDKNAERTKVDALEVEPIVNESIRNQLTSKIRKVNPDRKIKT